MTGGGEGESLQAWDVGFRELLGSLTTRVSSRSLYGTLQPSEKGAFSSLGENFGLRA